MLFGEKKKIDFLIENELKALPYSGKVQELFSADELMEIENAADKVKKRLKTINENLSSKEKEKRNFTYKDMSRYFYTIMLAYMGEKLLELLKKEHDISGGYDREAIDNLIDRTQEDVAKARKNAPEYKEMISKTIDEIVAKKKR